MATTPIEKAVDNFVSTLSLEELKQQKFEELIGHYEFLSTSRDPLDVLECEQFIYNNLNIWGKNAK